MNTSASPTRLSSANTHEKGEPGVSAKKIVFDVRNRPSPTKPRTPAVIAWNITILSV